MLFEAVVNYDDAGEYIKFILDLATNTDFPLHARVILCEKFVASAFSSQLKIKLIEIVADDKNYPLRSIKIMLQELADEEDMTVDESFEIYYTIRNQRNS